MICDSRWLNLRPDEQPSRGAHISYIFKNRCQYELDIVVCDRLGSIDRTIVKLLNWKDAVKSLENKIKYVDLYINSSTENDDNNLCGHLICVSKQVRNLNIKNQKYSEGRVCRMLHVRVKKLAREGLIDSFWISRELLK